MATAPKLMLTFYGDDFTGSTDAMEALALSGMRTVLFLSPPMPEQLQQKFSDVRCVGVAGLSRAMTPTEMDEEVEPVLRQLWSLAAPVTHYKLCSTFDSSPQVGSIGHVADMAHRTLTPGQTISVLASAPPLRRYTVFGNHFAAAGEDIFRLDRHPTMSRHPSTQMLESDLRLHLSKQTSSNIGLMNVAEMAGEAAQVTACHAAKLQSKPDLLLYDALTDEHLRTVGRLIWQQATERQHFSIGSSGVEYALTAHWRDSGVITDEPAALAPLKPVEQLLVVSGSASPLTAQQIDWASANGFDCIRVSAETLVQPEREEQARRALFDQALASLTGGNSVVLYSAAGPDDPSIERVRRQLAASPGGRLQNTAKLLGCAMGRVTRDLLAPTGLRRVVIAGGDTSSYAAQELGLYGLEMCAKLTPGAPLCRAYSESDPFDGLEIAFKGGQMGQVDYFGLARGQ